VRGVRILPPQLGQGLTVPSTLVRHDGARQVLTAGIDFPFSTERQSFIRRSHDGARCQYTARISVLAAHLKLDQTFRDDVVRIRRFEPFKSARMRGFPPLRADSSV
jgi:hypothetical protein